MIRPESRVGYEACHSSRSVIDSTRGEAFEVISKSVAEHLSKSSSKVLIRESFADEAF